MTRSRLIALFAAAACFACAVLVQAGAGASSGPVAGKALQLIAAAIAVFGGASALGPLLALTPVEPSPLKLGVLGAALAPLWLTGLAATAALVLGLGSVDAVSVALAFSGVLALFGSARRLDFKPLGAASWGSLALGAIVAAFTAWSLLGDGGTLRALGSPAHVTHVTLADQFVLRTPGGRTDLVQPFFQGGTFELRPALAALIATVSVAAGVGTSIACSLLCVWCALLIAPFAFLIVSGAGHGIGPADRLTALRDVAGTTLAVAAWLGLVWRGLLLDSGPEFAITGVLFAASVLTGLHAVRSGVRPWPQLFVVCLVGLGMLAPPLAVVVALGGVIVGVARGAHVFAVVQIAALLPGLYFGRVFGGFTIDQVARAQPNIGRSAVEHPTAAGAALVGVLALLGLAFRMRRASTSERAVRSASSIRFLAATSLGAAALVWLWSTVRTDLTLLAAASAFVAAPMLALALNAPAPSTLRAAGSGALLAISGAGLIVSAYWTSGVHASERNAFPLSVERSLFAGTIELVQDPPSAEGLGAAFDWIRRSPLARDPAAVLVRPGARGTQPSLAPLMTGLPLWWDGCRPPGIDQDRRLTAGQTSESASGLAKLGDSWAQRRDLLSALFKEEDGWEPRHQHLLREATNRGTRFVTIITEADRLRTTDRGSGPRGADVPWKLLGAMAEFETADVTVWVTPPVESTDD